MINLMTNTPHPVQQLFVPEQQLPASERIQNGDGFADFFHPICQLQSQDMADIFSYTYRTAIQNQSQWSELREWGVEVGNLFLDALTEGPDSITALDAVEELQGYLDRYFFACDEDTLACVGELYLHDAAVVDKHTPGLAQFVSDAILCYQGWRCA